MIRYLLILWAAMPFVASGQKQGMARIDSLAATLSTAHDDTSKVLVLNKISFAYRAIDPARGIRYATDALELARRLRWKKGVAIVMNTFYSNYFNLGDYSKAYEYATTSLKLNEELGDKRSIAVNLGNIANLFEAQSDYKTALSYQFRSLKLREELNDKPLQATCLMNVGNIYLELTNYPKAREYHLKALKIYESLNDQAGVAECYVNIGSAYQLQEQYTIALDYLVKALEIFRDREMRMQAQAAMVTIGDVYLAMKNYSRSLDYSMQALNISQEMGDKEGEAFAYGQVGKCYLQMVADSTSADRNGKIAMHRQANLDSAIKYLRNSIAISKAINSLRLFSAAQQDLFLAYKLNGNFREALESYETYRRVSDSVFSNDNKLKIAKLETQRETDLKNKQIELNKLASIKKRNEQGLLIGGLVVLFIAVVAVLRAHDKQKKANRDKEVLLRQKDMLMKEIHHRVKNNLQVISTLLDLQLQEVTDEQAKGAMAESTTRVRSISLIHQQLYQHDDIGTIEFSKFAAELVRQVMAVFKKGSVDITFENEIPEMHLDIDTAVPLGLILNELITNSFKYAFSGSSNGSIRIAIHQPDGHYQLIYSDSGPGLPDAAQHSSGLGMRMMRSLSKQLGGSFAYDAEKKQVIVMFKDIKGRKMID